MYWCIGYLVSPFFQTRTQITGFRRIHWKLCLHLLKREFSIGCCDNCCANWSPACRYFSAQQNCPLDLSFCQSRRLQPSQIIMYEQLQRICVIAAETLQTYSLRSIVLAPCGIIQNSFERLSHFILATFSKHRYIENLLPIQLISFKSPSVP